MQRYFITPLLLLTATACLIVEDQVSEAHRRSEFAVIDPVYSVNKIVPGRDIMEGAPWLYGPVEMESWKHQKMRKSSKAVAYHGHYPGVYHVPFKTAHFRFRPDDDCGRSEIPPFKSNGRSKVFFDDEGYLVFHLETSGEPPCLLIEKGIFATDQPAWEWKAEGTNWHPAARHPQTASGVMPHEAEMPEVIINPLEQTGSLYDFGRELIGYVCMTSDTKPRIIAGESMPEALDTVVSNHEQTLTIVRAGDRLWMSKYPLAFRYLQVIGCRPDKVYARAQFWPSAYRGAFACSDSLLTRIWMAAAYTHRLNKYQFMLDGIKRDRLPWVDNMKISSAVEALTFGDPEIIRRTLSVLGRASDQSSINNIVDYDALWLISQEAFQLHFGDTAFLKQEWSRIYAMVERIAGSCDENGLRRWPQGSWTFIDWVEGWDKNMSEQVMWWWAQESAVRLAERMGERAVAGLWSQRADQLKAYLNHQAWDQGIQAWTDPDKTISPTRHGNLLSIVSGLSSPEQINGAIRILTDTLSEPLNSPSMLTYQIMALNRNGFQKQALEVLRSVWGAMLESGSTTFWEGYDEQETDNEIYRFYGRPYGKSMCHAWAAGPVFLLPEILLGLTPLTDGWQQFEVDPALHGLKWVYATIPTRYGDVRIEVADNKLKAWLPDRVTMRYHDQVYQKKCVILLE